MANQQNQKSKSASQKIPRKKFRILIADDHEIVRHGLRNLIESEENFQIIAEATNGRDAVQLANQLKPDIVVLDIAMPDLNGIEATRQIHAASPNTRIVVFTMHETENLVQEIFRAGANAYVLKSDAGSHLLKALQAVIEGRHFFSSKVSELIFEGFLRASQAPTTSTQPSISPETPRITTREREIIQLLAEGKSNKEVASILGISVKTAETHRAAIMRKLNLHSLSELVRYAIRNQIIEP
ncbi:MAG: response regulator transcription factor [Chthoniobacterales bacterium]|nr:response regulator transcription factor [Chthoniobacterales bacterium]MCX7713734.1 response regulator transcription factor [Chthoniobacterales bacterium]